MAEGVSMHVTFSVFLFFFFHLWAFRDGKTRRTGEKMKQKKRFHLGCVISFFFGDCQLDY